jgi:hypothetical protein
MRLVVHTTGCMGRHVPVWDIRHKFGDTNLLATNTAQGLDLAGALGDNKVVLMSGHGYAMAGRFLMESVRIAIYLQKDASVSLQALRLGEVRALVPGEIELKILGNPMLPKLGEPGNTGRCVPGARIGSMRRRGRERSDANALQNAKSRLPFRVRIFHPVVLRPFSSNFSR